MAHPNWKRTLLLASFFSATAAGGTAAAQGTNIQSLYQQTGQPAAAAPSPYPSAPSRLAAAEATAAGGAAAAPGTNFQSLFQQTGQPPAAAPSPYPSASTRLTAAEATAAGGAAAAPGTNFQSLFQQTGQPPAAAPSPYQPAAARPAAAVVEASQGTAAVEEQHLAAPRGLAGPLQDDPPAPAPCAPPPGLLQRCKNNLQACFIGFASEFQAPPLGHFVYEHARTQVDNGEAARMVLHHFDFVEGSDRLNVHGQDELARIASWLPRNFYPVVVERTPEVPGLAEARRTAIVNELAKSPFPVPPERVVIGAALAKDLRGTEAVIVYQNMLGQTRASGTAIAPGIQSILSNGTGGGGSASSVGPPGGSLTPP